MYPAKQSTALTMPVFAHDVNGDAVTGLTDGSFTKRISKNGAAFGAMTVTITELENGWYSIPLGTGHTDTLGILSVTFTNGGAKQINAQFRVHARLPDDLTFPLTSGRATDVTATGAVGIDWGNVENQGTTVDLSATDIQLADTTTTLTNKTGFSLASTGLDAISQAATGMVEIAKAVWDRVLTGATHNITDSAGKRLRQAADANQPLDEGTAQGGAPGSITLASTADAVNDDIYEDAFVSILSGTGLGQVRFITSYTASSRVALVHEDWIVTPAADSVYDVHGSAAADVHAIADSNTAALNLLADYDGTGFDKANSTIGTTTTNTDMVGTDSALLAASAPTNFGDLAITVTTGLVDVNDKTGFGIAVGGIAATAFAAGAVDAAAIAADAIGSSELATSAVNEIVDQVWNEPRTDHTTQGSYGETMDTVVSGNAITGTLSTTLMTTDLTEITDDHYNGRTIIWTSGVLIDQATNITDYDGGTKMLTFTAVTEAPSNTDDFIIV